MRLNKIVAKQHYSYESELIFKQVFMIMWLCDYVANFHLTYIKASENVHGWCGLNICTCSSM